MAKHVHIYDMLVYCCHDNSEVAYRISEEMCQVISLWYAVCCSGFLFVLFLFFLGGWGVSMTSDDVVAF